MVFSKAIAAGQASSSEAFEIFDTLDSVDTGFMIGSWKGAGFHTGHPMDGLLEAYHWHGKRFEDTEHVHPLVFSTFSGRRASINPVFILPVFGLLGRGASPKSQIAQRMFSLCMPLFTTRRSRARLRMTDHRGKSSATMIYDNLPIHDVFRKIDENTVFGVMDLKDVKQPFFFVLQREKAAGKQGNAYG